MATAESQSRAENSAKNLDLGKDAVTTRLNALQSLQAERAPLLGGEATSAHGTRHNEARKVAATALDTAREALAAAMNISAAAQAKSENTADELSGAQKTLETAEATLADALVLSDLVQDDLDRIFALEETTIVGVVTLSFPCREWVEVLGFSGDASRNFPCVESFE
ncbi:hypothetical protein, partial [Agrobacterium vitis]